MRTGPTTTTYTWDIEKSVDQTLVQQVGGTATFTYTVHVTHDDGTIGNIKVSGNDHGVQPAIWPDITGAGHHRQLSDQLDLYGGQRNGCDPDAG